MDIITVSPKNTKEPAKEPKTYPSSHSLTAYNYKVRRLVDNGPFEKARQRRARTGPDFCNSRHNEPPTRPSVLSKMPPSCNLVYDILKTLAPDNGVVSISQRELAAITHRSKTQIRRALRRLCGGAHGVRILRLVDCGGRDRKAVYYLRWKSYSQKGGPLTIREELKDTTKTQKKNQPRQPHSGSFTLESYKNMPKDLPLPFRDKRKVSAIGRKTCEPGPISAVLDVLYQRDPVSGVWLTVIKALRGLTIDAQPEELVWRARKGIAALIGGLNEDGFKVIMLDEVSEEEATKREVAKFQRRLVGLRKSLIDHNDPDYDAWYIEMKASLERMLCDAQDGIRYDDNDNRIDERETVAGNGKARVEIDWKEFEKRCLLQCPETVRTALIRQSNTNRKCITTAQGRDIDDHCELVEKRSELTRQRYETQRRLPGAIRIDGFFKTIDKPQPQPRPAKRFKLTGFYTAKREVLEGEALRRRKQAARKALSNL